MFSRTPRIRLDGTRSHAEPIAEGTSPTSARQDTSLRHTRKGSRTCPEEGKAGGIPAVRRIWEGAGGEHAYPRPHSRGQRECVRIPPCPPAPAGALQRVPRTGLHSTGNGGPWG